MLTVLGAAFGVWDSEYPSLVGLAAVLISPPTGLKLELVVLLVFNQ